MHSDLEVLQQRRLQDVLLRAPVTPDDDLHTQWERRLPALLDRRELHLQVRPPGTVSVGAAPTRDQTDPTSVHIKGSVVLRSG